MVGINVSIMCKMKGLTKLFSYFVDPTLPRRRWTSWIVKYGIGVPLNERTVPEAFGSASATSMTYIVQRVCQHDKG